MFKKRKRKKNRLFLLIVIVVFTGITYISQAELDGSCFFESRILSDNKNMQSDNTVISEITYGEIPEYTGNSPYIAFNGNCPLFTDADYYEDGFEYYSPLDELGRCGLCIAKVGIETMPIEKRGDIGMVKPSGWHTAKYAGIVEGNYLYNRCHLIGYQLSAENANECNLITGTRYLNVSGMLPFENRIAEYVKATGNHVLYRVTPVFDGNNLVASGVLLEAKSVEDRGKELSFCVYCYNVQPGIHIDYRTGESIIE